MKGVKRGWKGEKEALKSSIIERKSLLSETRSKKMPFYGGGSVGRTSGEEVSISKGKKKKLKLSTGGDRKDARGRSPELYWVKKGQGPAS